MPPLCILTDDTVQFIKPVFPGRSLVKIIPLQIRADPEELNLDNLGHQTRIHYQKLLPYHDTPGIADILRQFNSLAQEYNEIIVLVHSAHISSLYEFVAEAGKSLRGRIAVRAIDTQTTSIGLGYIVQIAAAAAEKYANSDEIERIVREIVPHVYSLFSIPELLYLSRSGFIDYAQAYTCDLLGMLPIFSLEDGTLSSVEKVHNSHQLFDFFQEFLEEFSSLHHVSIIQSIPAMVHESHSLRDFAQSTFIGTPFTEHPINTSLASIIGPHSLGIFAIENSNGK
jgi:DegV family protein with EDD domain